MTTHLEPDILESEVKWALGTVTINKASGGDGIPAELFQILKDEFSKFAAILSAALLQPHLLGFDPPRPESKCQQEIPELYG